MEQNRNEQTNENTKYFLSLSFLLKPYRWMGIIRFNDYGKVDKKLVAYSIFVNFFETVFLFLGSYYHIISYVYNLDKVSRIPFVMEWVSHSLHFTVATWIFLHNSEFLIKMFSRTEGVRFKLAEGDTALKNGALNIRFLSLIILSLTITATATFIVTGEGDFGTKFILTVGYLLSVVTYLKEETLLLYAKFLHVMLHIMNGKIRTSTVTPESIRKFRYIHNELSLLSENVSEHFEPLITTMVATTGIQSWGNCFTLIRIATSENPNVYLVWTYLCNMMYQFLKLWYMCKTCENVEQQVIE